MKGIINNSDYTFDASLQTVTLDAAYTGIGIENILLITNLIDGEIIYQFNNVAKAGTIAGLVITLAHNTTSMADTDELMIIFDWDGINATVNVAGTITVGEVEVKNDSGNPIPVSDNGGSLTVDAASLPLPTGASTLAEQQTQTTALQIIDDWDESDRAKVNPVVGQAGVQAGSGAVSSNTQRVTIATDDAVKTNLDDIRTAIQILDNAISGSEMQVDIVDLPTLTETQNYGSTTSMTVTNLNSLANSATAGWQSDRVSNLNTVALDYEIFVKLTMANTAPANDKAVYVYICPFFTDDAGSTWYASSGGTTTLPSGSQGTYTIASPNNLRLLGILSYTTQNMVLQDTFLLSNAFGSKIPDGFSIIIVNYSGAAIAASTNLVKYTPLKFNIT